MLMKATVRRGVIDLGAGQAIGKACQRPRNNGNDKSTIHVDQHVFLSVAFWCPLLVPYYLLPSLTRRFQLSFYFLLFVLRMQNLCFIINL